MSDQTTLKDTSNATSSRGLAAGVSRSDLPCGMTLDLFGQEAAPVSHSAQQAGKKATATSATYGRIGQGLSESQNLQRYLESKLREQLPMDGWTKSLMIWKRKNTPALRQYCQLAVSGSRTKEIESGLWLSPACVMTVEHPDDMRARAEKNGYKNGTKMGSLASQAAFWATPAANEFTTKDPQRILQRRAECKERHGNNGFGLTLGNQVTLWATPNTMDGMGDRSPEAMERQFSTTRKGRTAPANLREQVNPSMWPTPSARDYKDTGDMSNSMIRQDGKHRINTLGRLTFTGSTAPTEKQGQLNVEFVCWLMGYSTAHLSSMLSAMQSFPKSRRNLSKQQCDINQDNPTKG